MRTLPLTLADQDHNSTVIHCGVCSCPWQTKTTVLLLLTVESTADLRRPRPQFYCYCLWSLQLTFPDQDHNSTVIDCGVCSWPSQTKTTILLLLTVESAADLRRPRPRFYCYWLSCLQLTFADQDHNSTVIDCLVCSWPSQTKTTILLLLTVLSAADLRRPRPQFYSQSFLTRPHWQGNRFTETSFEENIVNKDTSRHIL